MGNLIALDVRKIITVFVLVATVGMLVGSSASADTAAPGADESSDASVLATTDNSIMLSVQAVVPTESGIAIAYMAHRADSVSSLPLLPVGVTASAGEVTEVRHVGAFLGASVGLIFIEVEDASGLTVDVTSMVGRSPYTFSETVIEGEWELRLK